MTAYSLGDRVLVRVNVRSQERPAEVLEDRGSRVRLLVEGLGTTTIPKARVRPVPPPRVAPIIPPPYIHEATPERIAEARAELRAVPKPPKPWRSEAYLDFVRGKACAAVTLPIGKVTPCSGDVIAHHHGPRGTGQKTDDSRTVPLCDGHHREFHDTGTLGGIERAALDAEFAVTMAWLLLQYITLDAFGRIAPSWYETVVKALTAALQEG